MLQTLLAFPQAKSTGCCNCAYWQICWLAHLFPQLLLKGSSLVTKNRRHISDHVFTTSRWKVLRRNASTTLVHRHSFDPSVGGGKQERATLQWKFGGRGWSKRVDSPTTPYQSPANRYYHWSVSQKIVWAVPLLQRLTEHGPLEGGLARTSKCGGTERPVRQQEAGRRALPRQVRARGLPAPPGRHPRKGRPKAGKPPHGQG